MRSLPSGSTLREIGGRYVHIDSHAVTIKTSGKTISVEEVAKAFFLMEPPVWISTLFTIRNHIVRIFGLKTTDGKGAKQQSEFKLEVGQKLGFSKVYIKSTDEVVFGEDDKHLNFRVSLFLDQQTAGENSIVISTVV
jgi:hypothetical protein